SLPASTGGVGPNGGCPSATASAAAIMLPAAAAPSRFRLENSDMGPPFRMAVPTPASIGTCVCAGRLYTAPPPGRARGPAAFAAAAGEGRGRGQAAPAYRRLRW